MSCQSNPVRWFEIPVGDMPRATKFYQSTLECQITPMEGAQGGYSFFPMEPGKGGSGGALRLAPEFVSADRGVTIYLGVDSIDPALERIKQAGGKVLTGRESIGPHGFIAQFVDTEGNRIALHEPPAGMGQG